jgi:peptidoglycan hydrolase-like protein with peptidoglycan-binding domain
MKLFGFFLLIAILMYSPALADAESVAIQGRLKVEGYYDGPINGNLGGEATRTAIRSFQGDKDLPTTGHVGPKTYRALFGRSRGDNTPSEPVDLKANLGDRQ